MCATGNPDHLVIGAFRTSYPAKPQIQLDPIAIFVYDFVGNGAVIPPNTQMTVTTDLTYQGSGQVWGLFSKYTLVKLYI